MGSIGDICCKFVLVSSVRTKRKIKLGPQTAAYYKPWYMDYKLFQGYEILKDEASVGLGLELV